MTADLQKPIGSKFNHGSTAMAVAEGHDLKGKAVIITGGYSGIGLETTRAMLATGAHVLVPARNRAKAEKALAPLAPDDGRLGIAHMDLGDLSSVAAFVEDYLDSGNSLHYLLNNAGIMACPETRVGPAWEAQFATNHIGHFALTIGLLPALRKANGARVICLSSIAHRVSGINFDDLHFRTTPYHKWVAYGQAKTANALFALELDKRYKDEGIKAFSVHPGGIMTDLQRHMDPEEFKVMGWMDQDGNLMDGFKTPEQGAATTVWGALSPDLDAIGGLYLEDCEVAQLCASDFDGFTHVRPHATDEEAAYRLWQVSEAMTGLKD